jgi:hypothetical protein
MSQRIEIKDKKFGRLLVLERADNNKYHQAQWKCRCDCGNEKVVPSRELRSGHSKSCGCLKIEMATERIRKISGGATTHGHTKGHKRSPTYSSYHAAKNRCNNPNVKNYVDYGGRGIQFKFKSFEEFYEELGPRPEGKEIERIDNDGNYEKGNVKWSTHKEQCNNRRSRWRKKAA